MLFPVHRIERLDAPILKMDLAVRLNIEFQAGDIVCQPVDQNPGIAESCLGHSVRAKRRRWAKVNPLAGR